MGIMTDEEAFALDEYYTKNPLVKHLQYINTLG
jgi:hypothetical protein